MELISTKIKSIPILITLFFLEIFIGGPGNLFTIFQVPVRQVIFALLLIFSFVHFASHKVKPQSGDLIIISLIFWACTSAFIGLIKGHDMVIVFNDISPMMFFLAYFPLRVYFSKYEISYEYFLKILTHSSVFISLIMIYMYVIIAEGSLGLYIFTSTIQITDLFWTRANGAMFYPGLVYVLVSIILLLGKFIDYGKVNIYEMVSLSLSFVVIIMSETRGLILALILALFMLLFLVKTSVVSKFKLILIGVFCGYIALFFFDLSRFLNIENDSGIIVRMNTIDESLLAIQDNILRIKKYAKLSEKVVLIENHYNLGIAKALNIGCKYLLSNDILFGVLLDQDSVVTPRMVNILHEYSVSNKNCGIVGPLIIPQNLDIEKIKLRLKFVKKESAFIFTRIHPSPVPFKVAFNITSGSLCNLNIWKELGGFWEELFIDGVDNEYGSRSIFNEISLTLSGI